MDSGSLFRGRYKPPVPFGQGRYVGLKRKPWVETEESKKNQREAKRAKSNYTEPEAAGCVHGVRSRRIWQAVVSCLIEEGITLGAAARYASPIYRTIMREAYVKNWSPEKITLEILNATQGVGQALQKEAKQEAKQQRKKLTITIPFQGATNKAQEFARFVSDNKISEQDQLIFNAAETG